MIKNCSFITIGNTEILRNLLFTTQGLQQYNTCIIISRLSLSVFVTNYTLFKMSEKKKKKINVKSQISKHCIQLSYNYFKGEFRKFCEWEKIAKLLKTFSSHENLSEHFALAIIMWPVHNFQRKFLPSNVNPRPGISWIFIPVQYKAHVLIHILQIAYHCISSI